MISKWMRVMMAVAIAGTFSLGLGCEKEDPASTTPPAETTPTDGATPPAEPATP